jgi:hypothetical protein
MIKGVDKNRDEKAMEERENHHTSLKHNDRYSKSER